MNVEVGLPLILLPKNETVSGSEKNPGTRSAVPAPDPRCDCDWLPFSDFVTSDHQNLLMYTF